MLGVVWADITRRGFLNWHTRSEHFRGTGLQAVIQALLLPGVRRLQGSVHYLCTEIGWHGDGAEAEAQESDEEQDEYCESFVLLSDSGL